MDFVDDQGRGVLLVETIFQSICEKCIRLEQKTPLEKLANEYLPSPYLVHRTLDILSMTSGVR